LSLMGEYIHLFARQKVYIGNCRPLLSFVCHTPYLFSPEPDVKYYPFEKICFERAIEIIIRKLSFKTLSPLIGLCTNLERLYLTRSGIETLPKEIRLCVSLKLLHCDDCPLTEIPIEIGQCKALKYLDFSDTKITSIPEEISELTNLKSIALFHCNITTLPLSLGKCKSLVSFWISKATLFSNPALKIFSQFDKMEIAEALKLRWRDTITRNFKRALFSLILKEEPHLMSKLPVDIKKNIFSYL
jgi:hypothetical protein